jgi:predicted site-specific integrase-resolvase
MLSEGKVAELLDIPVGKLRRWRWEGRGPIFVRLEKDIRYHPADVEAYLAARRCVPSVQAYMEERHVT